MTNTRTVRLSLLIFLLLTVINVAFLPAQSGTSCAISGTVTDTTGATVSGAEVTATDLNTKAVRAGKTSAEGRFLFSQVNPGIYTAEGERAGFCRTNLAANCRRSRPDRNAQLSSHRFIGIADSRGHRQPAVAEPRKSKHHNDAGIEDHREPAQPRTGPDLHCAVLPWTLS